MPRASKGRFVGRLFLDGLVWCHLGLTDDCLRSCFCGCLFQISDVCFRKNNYSVDGMLKFVCFFGEETLRDPFRHANHLVLEEDLLCLRDCLQWISHDQPKSKSCFVPQEDAKPD